MTVPRPADRPHRLGVHPHGDGVDVAVLASHATAVDLCLLDADPSAQDGLAERRVPLTGPTLGVWHAHVPGVGVGQRYGFRAHGPWDPAAGTRYNAAKLLVDPYARGLIGEVRLEPSVYGQVVDADGQTVGPVPQRSDLDSRADVPHAVVVDDRFDGAPVPRPRIPWTDTVIYETHVRGLTRRLPGVPPELRGTYAGLAHPVTLEHLRSLGVTSIELLPIHAMASEPHLARRGLTNYWGYSTLGFFAPNPAYATATAQAAGPQAVLAEVKGMVRLLHAAGLEVILDVVYNHTCEGGTDGPQLSWRGLDPTVYYLHDGGTPARFADVTGTGNSMDFRRPRVVQLALDSLRYWADVIDVDGFRFDLAVTLGRDDGFTPRHPFLTSLLTDPVLADRKMIAEPWDVGPGGWHTGAFPEPMAEWNDRFRNAVRTFWLADPAQAAHGFSGHGVRELATRLAGSADLFGYSDPPLMRGVIASVNYITAHDGFTLADLVAFEHKNNLANGENNRDGTDDNRSWNHGVEGPVRDESIAMAILPLRRRTIRNLLGTLLLAAGTPMITAGDELGRSQGGNNNAYSQDNETSWVDWDLRPWQENLLETTRYLLRLRREHPALRAERFFWGVAHRATDARPDLDWRAADGSPFDHHRWHDTTVRTLQMVRTAEDGSSVLLILNGSLDPVEVSLADGVRPGDRWELAWDSTWEHPGEIAELAGAGAASNGGSGDDGRENGGLHALPGDRATLEPLSLRAYTSR